MTKYRIMFLLSQRENLGSLYKFDTTKIDNETLYREFDTLEAADSYVETLLNKSGYSKNDVLVVQVKDYDISTNIEESGSGTEEPVDPTSEDKEIPESTIYYNKDTDSYFLHTNS